MRSNANAALHKIQGGEYFDESDLKTIRALLQNTQRIGARTEFVREGWSTSNVHILLEGVACCFKLLPDGKRAIFAYHVPGDFCDLAGAIFGHQDYSVTSLTPCVIAEISERSIAHLILSDPKIMRALWRRTLIDARLLRAWLVCAGKRSSAEHLAHFICEYVQRLKDVDCADDDNCAFPMTQEELADTLGITPVHVSRTLQLLKDDGYIELRGRAISILNFSELKRFAQFDPVYLEVPPQSGVAVQTA